MRVVHIARGFGDYMSGLLGGIATLSETHVVLAAKDQWLASELPPQVHVYTSGAEPVRSPANLVALRRVARYIRDVQPDVLHFQSGLVWELALMPMFPRIPSVMTIHDVTRHPSYGRMRWFPQRLLDLGGRLADAVIVHATALVPAAEQRYEKPQRVFAIAHGLISRYGTGVAREKVEAGGHVLMFGTIDAWKGVEYLLAAVPQLRNRLPQVDIRIAGACEHPERYLSLLHTCPGLHMDLRRQSDAEVRALFEWADVVVLPYVEASQSGVLQLAFSFGVPVVVTDVGGLPEAVATDACGLVVPARNPQRLADAIVQLIEDTGLRKQVIENIVRARGSRFDWRRLAVATLAVYEDVRRLKFAAVVA